MACATAAVCDFAPAEQVAGKFKKAGTGSGLTLRFAPTADILEGMGRNKRPGQVLVGFAAETQDVVAKAREKRARKQVDLIVANDVSRADAGFDVESNVVTLVGADGEQALPLQSKADVARAIVDRIVSLLAPVLK